MIEFQKIYKGYKEKKSVLCDVNLTVKTNEFLVLIGSSGCGKTTLLKMVNKLNTIDRGDILLDGISVKNIQDNELRRKIGYVVQDGGLFPHLTISENINILLKITRMPEADRYHRINELLHMVDLDPDSYRNLYPSQLSGGQRQRVGVARAFATDPDLILMDEPFSALDPVTRTELQDEICKLHKLHKKTIIFVTHDMEEAIKLADRICIIQNGHIIQCDTPENILKHPKNDYVEEFIGKNKLWSNPEFIKAEDIMKLNPIRISRHRTVLQACHIMNYYSINSVLVTNQNVLEGVVLLSDICNSPASTPVSEYISYNYISVFNNTSLKKIINTIDCNISGIIPVIDHEKHLLGYLSNSILLATISKQYEEKDTVNEAGGTI